MRLYCNLFSSCNRPFYITTPIFYVNAKPHIGHLYSAVIADTIQRFQKLTNPARSIIFSTGTDEHGTKVQQAAAKHKKPVDAYCNSISQEYKKLFQDCGIDYTNFIRTTDEKHKNAVQHFWNELKNRDFIYQSQYSGWYCINDESFLTDTHLRHETRDGKTVKVSIESGHPVEWTEEKNYMFRMSSLKTDLKYWFMHCNPIRPEKYMKILLDNIDNFNYLPDISVSRPSSRVDWAIRVPDDPEQSIYVWLDALINYLTVAGYPDTAKGNLAWPADVHVVGKDILKFHALYWPAFLLAAGLEPPRSILCHGHWIVDGRKMSKSLDNVICPYDTLGGLDALRYSMLKEGSLQTDLNYSEVKMTRILNAHLADTMGNLLNRCTGISLNPKQEFPELHSEVFREIRNSDAGSKLIKSVDVLPDLCHAHYSDYKFYLVVENVMLTLHAANVFFENQKPWVMKKLPGQQKQLDTVLHVTMETLRICSMILQPIIPEMSAKILNKLSIPDDSRRWDNIKAISWQSDVTTVKRNISNDKLVLFQKIILDKEKLTDSS